MIGSYPLFYVREQLIVILLKGFGACLIGNGPAIHIGQKCFNCTNTFIKILYHRDHKEMYKVFFIIRVGEPRKERIRFLRSVDLPGDLPQIGRPDAQYRFLCDSLLL